MMIFNVIRRKKSTGSGGSGTPPPGESSPLNSPSYTYPYNMRPAPPGYELPTSQVDTRRDGDFFANGVTFASGVVGTGVATVYTITTGAELDTAFNTAKDINAKAVFKLTGNITLTGVRTIPTKQAPWWYIMSDAMYNGTFGVGEGERCTPSTMGYRTIFTSATENLGFLVGPDTPNASFVRFLGIEVSVLSTSVAMDTIFALGGNSDTTEANLPHHHIIDQCYIHGHNADDSTKNVKRGVGMNGKHQAVVDSYISSCKHSGADSQAIGGWAGSGPFLVCNNYLEGAGENILFGGAWTATIATANRDIIVRRNHMKKPLSWLAQTTVWSVKNIFEIKGALRCLVECNKMENVWAQGQAGWPFVVVGEPDFDPATTRHIIMRDIWCDGLQSIGGFGSYGAAEGEMDHIMWENILFTRIGDPALSDGGAYPAPLRGFEFSTAIQWNGLYLNHISAKLWSTVVELGKHMLLTDQATAGKFSNFVMTNVILPAAFVDNGRWSCEADGFEKTGTDIVAPSHTVSKNVHENSTAAGTLFPNDFYGTLPGLPDADALTYSGLATYRPSVGSGFRNAGTDGEDIGIIATRLSEALAGVES